MELIAFHDSTNGELNENETFLNALHEISNNSFSIRLEEYYNEWLEIYLKKGTKNEYFAYFTVEHDHGDTDGYIYKNKDYTKLFKIFGEKRGYDMEETKEYIEDFEKNRLKIYFK